MEYNPLAITGSIIIVEDDPDDRFFLEQIFTELNIADKAIYFSQSTKALDYLNEDGPPPFIIISDINVPIMNGLEFKRKIDQNPRMRQKSIPFIFFSTAATKSIVDLAYREFFIQGFFQKNDSYEQLKQDIYYILTYWQKCKHPNNF